MKKAITVQWVEEEEWGYGKAMRVIESDHPRFTVGSRFDFGFFNIATDEGYKIVSLPMPTGSAIFDGLARRVVSRVLRDQEAAWGPVADEIETTLRNAVNASCCCGGHGHDDPRACPACMVWHRMTRKPNTEASDAKRSDG